MASILIGLNADFESTKDPESDDEKSGKGKKNGNTKGQRHNPMSQGALVSARLIIIQILWPIPTCRIMVSVVRESHLLEKEGQESILRGC